MVAILTLAISETDLINNSSPLLVRQKVQVMAMFGGYRQITGKHNVVGKVLGLSDINLRASKASEMRHENRSLRMFIPNTGSKFLDPYLDILFSILRCKCRPSRGQLAADPYHQCQRRQQDCSAKSV